MKRDDRSPEAYRADVEGVQREMLETLRELVFAAAPDIDEEIEYGMLSYPGLASLAAQKHSVNLYVYPPTLHAHRADFVGVDHGKSCLRFKKPGQIDRKAVEKLLVAVRKDRRATA